MNEHGHDPWNGCLGGKIGDPCPGCGMTKPELDEVQACPLLPPFNDNPEIAKDFDRARKAYDRKRPDLRMGSGAPDL